MQWRTHRFGRRKLTIRPCNSAATVTKAPTSMLYVSACDASTGPNMRQTGNRLTLGGEP